MIVLDELRRDEWPELLEVKALHEEPSRIATNIQLHELKAVNFERGDLHGCSGDETWDKAQWGPIESMRAEGRAGQFRDVLFDRCGPPAGTRVMVCGGILSVILEHWYEVLAELEL